MFGVGKVFKKHFETKIYFYSSIKLLEIYNIEILTLMIRNVSSNFQILQRFLKDHVALKTGGMAPESPALLSHEYITF